MLILGLETSCDETAAAVVRAGKKIEILSNVVSSQIELHAQWGGVVPNLAAREHVKNILPVISAALEQAKITPADLDLIAVTNGPGLIPALLIGTNAAKTLAYLWQKPLLGIHHVEGHIYANFIKDEISKVKSLKSKAKSDIQFPILCLVVSGGHTQLVFMKSHLHYEIIGQTMDDAAGEAFDKVARILNLGYPGGPAVAAAAKCGSRIVDRGSKNDTRYALRDMRLPRPMLNSKNFNFSFSGLKTAVLYTVKKNPKILQDEKLIAQLSAEFQQAVVDVLIHKTLAAAQKYAPKTILLAGGVSANEELRKQLGTAIKKTLPQTQYQLPETKYSIDNAAMIASAGFFRWKIMSDAQRKLTLKNWRNLKTEANLKLK
ncbi:MAG: tRNA (adenosine(37)-N6)-threonylcarbamoyltransferase complex transferase subunit TsaD [Parcubacteria group bacterium]|jgi:N6-L-threonylcarbamoyladenine synthase